jgi:flagellar biosynthesis/type III secretory pathway protein FliH
MSHDQELRAIFQIHSIPEQAQKELRELFKKSNRDGFQEGWREGHEDGFYEATDE